jgi:hypothetical protein
MTITNIPTVVKKHVGDEEMRIFLSAEIEPNIQQKSTKIHFIIPDRFRESFDSLCFHLHSYSTDWFQISCSNWAVVPLDELDLGFGKTILYIKYF